MSQKRVSQVESLQATSRTTCVLGGEVEDDAMGPHAGQDRLQIRIEQFINYFNATMARPFRWTYAGKPLAE